MRISLLFLLGGMVGALGASEESFEAPVHQAGSGLEVSPGWSGSEAVIRNGAAWKGAQAVEIKPAEAVGVVRYASKEGMPEGIRFVELAVKPVGLPAQGAETALNVYGSEIGFIRGTDGKITVVAVDGKTQKSQAVETEVGVDENGQASDWIQINIRQDEKAKTWDLTVDGRLALVNVGVNEKEAGSIDFYGDKTASSYLDALKISPENPLFKDSDGDGMPDGEEVAYGLNPFVNDREADLDGDGVNNLQEFRKGSSPAIAGEKGATVEAILFVDNLNGNDANSGKKSYEAAGQSGPKASLKAAMGSAQSGDLIVVLPGSGVYDEGSRGAEGKAITIKTVGVVTIK